MHGKPVENRDWATNFRGRIYLHASKFWKQSDIEDDLDDVQEMAILDSLKMPEPDLTAMRAAGGCIVGSVEITDCIRTNKINSAFFVGDYGFVLANPITFTRPIPFKGALGFFDVPDEIVYAQAERMKEESL